MKLKTKLALLTSVAMIGTCSIVPTYASDVLTNQNEKSEMYVSIDSASTTMPTLYVDLAPTTIPFLSLDHAITYNGQMILDNNMIFYSNGQAGFKTIGENTKINIPIDNDGVPAVDNYGNLIDTDGSIIVTFDGQIKGEVVSQGELVNEHSIIIKGKENGIKTRYVWVFNYAPFSYSQQLGVAMLERGYDEITDENVEYYISAMPIIFGSSCPNDSTQFTKDDHWHLVCNNGTYTLMHVENHVLIPMAEISSTGQVIKLCEDEKLILE